VAARAPALPSGWPPRARCHIWKRSGGGKWQWNLVDGRRVDALAFVMRRDIPTYTGKLADEVVQAVFGCASGRYGTTLDYVSRTVTALRESGMPDRALEALLARCREAQSDGG
jgi:glutathione-specific gamma-glutamylcyclotransferase